MNLSAPTRIAFATTLICAALRHPGCRRINRLVLIPPIFALVVQACTMVPEYKRPPLPVSNSFPTNRVPGASGNSSTSGTARRQLAASDIGWRDFFTDARLQRLIEIALKNNRDLRVAALNVEASRAQYQIARAQLVPGVDAVAGDTRTETPQALAFPGFPAVYSEYQVGLSASWELDFWGRVRSLKNEALAQYLATTEASKATEISLVSEVANQYLNTLSYGDLLKVTRHALETAQQTYKLTKLEFETGTTSELDLREALTALDQIRANLQSQIRLRAQSEDALELLIGQPLPDDLPRELSLDNEKLLADIPAGLPSDLLTRRPDIMEAEDQLIAANADIGAARAAFFPKISLTGSAGTLSLSLGGLFKPGSGTWSFAPQISLPIFAGGQNIANLDRAHIQKNIEISQYEKAIQTAFREVADGLAARATYDEQIFALEDETESQQRRFDLAKLRFQNGVDSYLLRPAIFGFQRRSLSRYQIG
jgi:multidrug efflux system outer membrane protein